MPTFPTYESSGQISTNLPAPERHMAAEGFKDLQEIEGTLSDITQKWSEVNDATQTANAKASYESTAAKILAAQSADTGIVVDSNGQNTFVDNSAKYKQQLQEAQANALKGISNQQVAGQLAMDFSHNTELNFIKVQADFKNKQLGFAKSQVPTILAADQNKIQQASTGAEQLQWAHHSEDFLNKQVRAGVLTPEESQKFLNEAQETSVKYQVYNDPARTEDESTLLPELKDPEGKYAYLRPETRLKMIEEDQKRIFQNNQTYKREDEVGKNDRFQNIFQKSNEGTLTLSDLDKEEEDAKNGVKGALKQKEILEIRDGIQKRVKTDLEAIDKNNEDAEKYTKFIDDFISNETDRQKGRELIVKAFKEGITNPKEIAYLNQLKRETEGVEWDRQKAAMQDNKLIPFKNAVNAVGDFFQTIKGNKNISESDHAMAIKQILSRAAGGDDPQAVSQQVIKDTVIKANPAILNLDPNGQLVVDDNGFLRIMNNKGEHKEAK